MLISLAILSLQFIFVLGFAVLCLKITFQIIEIEFISFLFFFFLFNGIHILGGGIVNSYKKLLYNSCDFYHFHIYNSQGS